jgi:hypothetical protein
VESDWGVSAEQRFRKTRFPERPQKIANEFNEYFASVGKIAADKVKRLAEVNNIQIATACFTTCETPIFS